jgi:hypothetical protein
VRNRFLCTTTLALAILGASEVTWGEPGAMSAQQQEPVLSPQEPEASAAAVPDEPKDEPKKDKAPKKAEKEEREFRLKGRVFVRNTVSSDGWTNQLDLASVRAGVVYRDRAYNLRVEVEAELRGRNAEVRDAYLRLDPSKHLRVQAGRFKRPISAIALTSRWDLPVIERGYLNDLSVAAFPPEPDELPLSGRFIGATTTLRDTGLPGRPELIIGVFRSSVHDQLARGALDWSKQFPEDVFSRLEVEPLPGFRLATSLAWVGQLDTVGDPSTFRHGFVSSLDAVVEAGPLRAWFEVFTGTSSLHLTADGTAQGRFQAARAIVSGRLPVTDTIYVEPHVTGQYLDGSSELDDDRIIQGGGGINLGVGEGWRLQTAVDHASVDRLLLAEGTTLFQVQLATVF